jgi:hypothetical protein
MATDVLGGIDSIAFQVTDEGELEGDIPVLSAYQTVILELRLL